MMTYYRKHTRTGIAGLHIIQSQLVLILLGMHPQYVNKIPPTILVANHTTPIISRSSPRGAFSADDKAFNLHQTGNRHRHQNRSD
jgi:hypothetical protein